MASTAMAPRRRRQQSSRALAALVAGTASVAALWGAAAFAARPALAPRSAVARRAAAEADTATAPGAVKAEGASKCPYSKENMAMGGAPDGDGLLAGERYIAMNRFQVRQGSEPAFEQRWAQRKSSLKELEGFRYFTLLERVPPSGEDAKPYEDDFSYVSFTIWGNKKNFNAWRTGPAFKEAHGGGSVFDFFGMVINGFMTSKGPPKPAFWRGMLMEKSKEEKPKLQGGPGGQPDADGKNKLDSEVFVSMNRFTVAEGREREFEQRWAQRESKLEDMPGFRFFQLMRRDQTPDDEVNYISMAAWDDRAAFDNWRQGEGFQKAHGKKPEGKSEEGKPEGKPAGGPMGGVLVKPPIPYFYEGKLVLESDIGA
mmetsp:Transcript_16383/g.36036  ORF Transcript_16383/g.36036 Transcript_16383/m.36036 type:complete len:370 (+) Transcript_16383:84-1193(+)